MNGVKCIIDGPFPIRIEHERVLPISLSKLNSVLGIGSDHIKSGLVLIYHENSILRSFSKRFAMQSNRLSVSNPTFDASGEAYVVWDSRCDLKDREDRAEGGAPREKSKL